MPAPLAHLTWINAERTPDSVQQTAERIAHTIHDYDPRPAVAPRPAYSTPTIAIPGLTPADTLLLTETIREAISSGNTMLLDWTSVKSRVGQAGLTGDALTESLHAIAEADYVNVRLRSPDHASHYELTRFGYATGIAAVVPDIDDVHQRIIAALINNPPTDRSALPSLAAQAATDELIVDQLLRGLEDQGLVTTSRTYGGVRLHEISPTLRRLID
jgi:hypothetical protein